MILLSFDFETTGVDTANDRVIEVGAILWSTEQHKCLESYGRLVKTDVPISLEITKLTGITPSAVDLFGFESADALNDVLDMANTADAYVRHNIRLFDRKLLDFWASRENLEAPNKLIIDTMTDLPGTVGRQLSHMAADHGFLNMFPHSALADCQTVIKLLNQYDISKVIDRAKSPIVILQSCQSRANNADAKKLKFWWNGDYKIWWKAVKALDVDALKAEAPFEIVVRNDLTEAQLRAE